MKGHIFICLLFLRATVLSQAVSAVLCIWYARKKFKVLRLTRQERRFLPGAVKTGRIRKGVWHCFLMLTLLNFGMGALLLAGQSYVVPLFVADPTAEIMAYSRDYLYVIVPFYLFLGALMVYRTAIRSVGNTWAPFAACVIELAAWVLCAGVLSEVFGYKAVCFATPFAWMTALLLLIPVYIETVRKWKTEKLES